MELSAASKERARKSPAGEWLGEKKEKRERGKQIVKAGMRTLAFTNDLASHPPLDVVTDTEFPAASRVPRRVVSMPKMPVALVTSLPEKRQHPLHRFFGFF